MSALKDFKFVFDVEFLMALFMSANVASKALQSSDTDLAAAVHAVHHHSSSSSHGIFTALHGFISTAQRRSLCCRGNVLMKNKDYKPSEDATASDPPPTLPEWWH